MSGTRVIPASRRDEILEESIRQQRQGVLTYRAVGGWRAYKSVFTSGSSESATLRMLARAPRDGSEGWPMQPGDTLGVTFRLGHKKCMFSSVLRSVEPCENGAIVRLTWPKQIQQLQRRAYERAEPPRGNVVAVRIWQADVADGVGPGQRNVRHGQLEDISAGGMRLKIADPKDLTPGSTYRCSFSPRNGAPPVVFEATLRHREAGDEGRVSLGFQFIGLETSAEGRKTLDRLASIVTHFQHAGHRGTAPRNAPAVSPRAEAP